MIRNRGNIGNNDKGRSIRTMMGDNIPTCIKEPSGIYSLIWEMMVLKPSQTAIEVATGVQHQQGHSGWGRRPNMSQATSEMICLIC